MERVITGLLVLSAVFWGSAGHMDAPSLRTPAVVVDLAKIGWAPPRNQSDRAFFKDFTIGNLFSLDQNTRILFLNADAFVVYHTKQEGQDWRTAPRTMEAFFIRAKDGSLISTMRWPTRLRRSDNDLRESEARLVPLSDGRFLAFANGVMRLYGDNLDLLKEQKLEPDGPGGMWSAQSVAEGHQIFLRHESMRPPRATYFWLDSATLQVEYTSPGYHDRDFLVQAGVVAGEKSVFTLSQSGIRMIDRDHGVKTICADQLCRGDGLLRALSSRHIGLSGKNGIGIVDLDHGLIWSKSIGDDSKHFQFSEMQCAMSGKRFAFWITGAKKALFDGVKINEWPPTILVYERDSSKTPLVIRTTPVEGQLDFALSPGGTKLAVFDGAKVQVYLF